MAECFTARKLWAQGEVTRHQGFCGGTRWLSRRLPNSSACVCVANLHFGRFPILPLPLLRGEDNDLPLA